MHSWCTECRAKRHKEHYKNNINGYRDKSKKRHAKISKSPDFRRKAKERRLKNKFGIAQKDYDLMMFWQDGLCAGCRRKAPENSSLHVDHDHLTKKIRGLLCVKCNGILGFANDNPDILKSLIEYLRIPSNFWTGIEGNIKQPRAKEWLLD